MKFKRGLVVYLLILPLMLKALNYSISKNWLSSTKKQIHQDEYNPSLQNSDYKGENFPNSRYHFANRAKNLRAYLDENGMELMPRIINEKDPWSLKYHLNSIYRKEDDIKSYNLLKLAISGKKIVYQYQGLTLKYANSNSVNLLASSNNDKGKKVPGGVYFIYLKFGEIEEAKKAILLR
ncbi:MAG: hypothetical protein U9N06_02630 [candidate division WOR-3 bacterium]|nr:hypothetical protein [candidate division WOR-3 bacterium]